MTARGARAGLRRVAMLGALAVAAAGAWLLLRPQLAPASRAPAPETAAYNRLTDDPRPPAPPARGVSPATAGDANRTSLSAAMSLEHAALSELIDSIDLRSLVRPETCATPAGRSSAVTTLQMAERSARRVQELIDESVARARTVADAAGLDASARAELREDIMAVTDHTLLLSRRRLAMRIQAIATARTFMEFMDSSAGAFELKEGAVRFVNASDQVQFNHFQMGTSRLIASERRAQEEVEEALGEQRALLARQGPG